MSTADALDEVEKSLRRRFRVIETPVPMGSRTLSVLHPASAEDLIDELDFERDERLPYWAELWPSSKILGEIMLGRVGAGHTLLELGCGSGLVSTCAALAGFDVTASDYYEDACRFARVNVRRNGAGACRGLMLDWRDLPAALPRYGMVIAADVLYERPYGALVARAVAAALEPDGVAYIADPGRVGREEFLAALAPNGLRLARQTTHLFTDGVVRQTITLLTVSRVAAGATPESALRPRS